MNDACVAAKIEGETFHILRHTYERVKTKAEHHHDSERYRYDVVRYEHRDIYDPAYRISIW